MRCRRPCGFQCATRCVRHGRPRRSGFPTTAGCRTAGGNPRCAGIRKCIEDRQPMPAADPTCSLLLLRQENGPRQFALWSHGTPSSGARQDQSMDQRGFSRASLRVDRGIPAWTHRQCFSWRASRSLAAMDFHSGRSGKIGTGCPRSCIFRGVACGRQPVRSTPLQASRLHHGTVETGAGKLPILLSSGSAWHPLGRSAVELFEELALDLRRRVQRTGVPDDAGQRLERLPSAPRGICRRRL